MPAPVSIYSGILFITVLLGAWPALADDCLIGTYRGTVEVKGNSMQFDLFCMTDTSCTLVTTTDGAKPRTSKLEVIATPAINEAAQVFEYARRQDPDRVTNDEYSVIISQLQPSLKSGAKVEKCWDLNYPEPQYSLACKVNRPPHSDKQIYLFITLMAGCGEAFCRYVIYPLSRRASAG